MTVGHAVPGSLVSAKVSTIAKATIKAMFVAKLKLVAVMMVAASAGAWGLLAQPEPPPVAAVVNVQHVATLQEIPAEVLSALEENAAQLNPISISYTEVHGSRIPDREMAARFKISNESLLFKPVFHRLVWQDEKYYTLLKAAGQPQAPGASDQPVPFQKEVSFDGNLVYHRHLPEREPGMLSKTRNKLLKQFGRFASNANFDFGRNVYFNDGFTGLHFYEERESERGIRVKSCISYFLKDSGHQLESVASVQLDDRPLLKIEFRGENPYRVFADKMDIEQLKRDGAFKNAPVEEQQSRLENILAWRSCRRPNAACSIWIPSCTMPFDDQKNGTTQMCWCIALYVPTSCNCPVERCGCHADSKLIVARFRRCRVLFPEIRFGPQPFFSPS